jgi:RHS repeat-associated protein
MVTDPLGRFEQYAYDSAGRVVKQTLFNGREILYGYDSNGNLTSLTPPGRPAHTFAYTVANLDSVYSPPPTGLAVSTTRYTFNLDGQVTRLLRPDSLAIDVAYDSAGRPSTVTLPTGSLQFAYSPTSGILTQLTAPDGGTLSYAYDGSLPKTVTWGGVVQGSVGFAYDSNFRVSKIAVNGTDSVAFGYDKDNLVTSAGAMTFVRDSLNGRILRTVLGSNLSTWTYDDSTGLVARYAVDHATTSLFDAKYSRDTLGRIVQFAETLQGVSTTKAFTYDSIGRLDEVRVNGTVVSDYDYDPNGNRLRLTGQMGSLAATYDEQDRMLTYAGAIYSYTPAGELQERVAGTGTTRFAYDALGQLRHVELPNGTLIDYLVDATSRRIGKKVNGSLVQAFLYEDQIAPVAELNGSGAVVARFVYGTRENVPDYLVKSGAVYRLLTDERGSVRMVINTSTGDVVQRIDYDEYGQTVINTNPGFQPFGFAGGIEDLDTRLLHFGLREYDPMAGRWISQDPVGFRGGSSNLYSYSLEDPVNLQDASGLQATWKPLPGVPGAMYRIDMGQKPFPNVHIRWRDGSENIINHMGGWERRHGGRDLPPMPKGRKARAAVRKIAKPFVKRASKVIPVAGLLFMASDLYALSNNPCPGLEDIVDLFAPVGAVADVIEYILGRGGATAP